MTARSDVAVRRAALNLTLGREADTPFTLPTDAASDVAPPGALPELLEQARASRPDLQAADGVSRAATSAIGVARAGRRPEVGVRGRYEANAEGGPGSDGSNWSVFVGARFTLFDGFRTRARVARADAERRLAERQRTILADRIELEVREAYHGIEAARKRLAQAARAVELAEESLRIVRDRYAEGLTMLVDLLDTETALTRARSHEIAARRDLVLSDATLRLATGTL